MTTHHLLRAKPTTGHYNRGNVPNIDSYGHVYASPSGSLTTRSFADHFPTFAAASRAAAKFLGSLAAADISVPHVEVVEVVDRVVGQVSTREDVVTDLREPAEKPNG